MNIMLSRLHDCLFKDLIVPFMILKFRKLTLSYYCVRQLLDWLQKRNISPLENYFDIFQQNNENNVTHKSNNCALLVSGLLLVL